MGLVARSKMGSLTVSFIMVFKVGLRPIIFSIVRVVSRLVDMMTMGDICDWLKSSKL